MLPYFYEQDGDRFTPTDRASSPWTEGKQNGIAIGGLLVHLIEAVPTPVEMLTVRLTIDILSAVPLAPCTGRTRVIREGARIQMVEAELVADGQVAARAVALRTRIADTPPIAEVNPYPPPEDFADGPFMDPHIFGDSLRTRLVKGALREPGPGILWLRFGHEHIRGVANSPLLRAAILADFGGGLGSVIDHSGWTYANIDITLYLTRMPEGDWLLTDASTESAGNGAAISNAILADRRGPFARAQQTLFVAPRVAR